MTEQLVALLRTDQMTLTLACLMGLFGSSMLRAAIESSLLAIASYPALVGLALVASFASNAAGLTLPIEELSFREADAAESMQSLAITIVFLTAGMVAGCLLIVHGQRRLWRHGG